MDGCAGSQPASPDACACLALACGCHHPGHLHSQHALMATRHPNNLLPAQLCPDARTAVQAPVCRPMGLPGPCR